MDLVNIDALTLTLQTAQSITFDLTTDEAIMYLSSDESVSFELVEAQFMTFELAQVSELNATLETPTVIGARQYEGSYTVTPTTQRQTLLTANKLMTDDVTIEPIPSNYGLITWNGSTLTVS